MNKILAIDLDEVLAETVNEVLKFNNYMFKGKPLTREDISDYYLANMSHYNATKQDAIDFFGSVLHSPARENILPIVGAKEKLEELRSEGWKTAVVTARREENSEYTYKWLERYYPGLIDEVLFANHFSENAIPKSALCQKIGATTMIEDNLDFSTELTPFGIKVFLLDKPWNRHYDQSVHHNIIKVSGWQDISL